jgi:Ca2+-binding RTX toxin-like protein
VFTSVADNIVPGDTNGIYDVFVRDRQTGVSSLVSTDSAGAQGNGDSYNVSISDDGRYALFASLASNLVSGDNNGSVDYFIKDLVTGVTSPLLPMSNQSVPGLDNDISQISGNGRFAAFISSRSDLVAGDVNGLPDIFVKDLQTGVIQLVSTASDGTQANGHSHFYDITPDGRYVLFESDASNLVAGDNNHAADLFVKDLVTGTTVCVSTASDGAFGNAATGAPGSFGISISDDGRYVTFGSSATNLVPGDTNRAADVFVKDLLTGVTTRVSLAADGSQGDADSKWGFMPADDQFVVFQSLASNFAGGSTTYASYAVPLHPDRTGSDLADHFYNINLLDTVHSLGGDDLIEVWSAPALVDGGEGNDVVRIRADVTLLAGSLVNVETVYADNLTTIDVSAIDHGLHIKSLSRAGAEVTATGTALDDLFIGGAGSDHFVGGGGNDRFSALNAGDSAAGGAGDDRYYVSDGAAAVSEAAGQGTDIVYAATSYALGAGASVEILRANGAASGVTLTGNAIDNRIIGSSGDDTLEGGAGADRLEGGARNDRLNGGAGNDSMRGGAGDDIYSVDSATDVLVELAGEGTDIVFASVTRALGANFERLTLTGGGNVNGTGNDLANVIEGNGGSNVIAGLGGDDKLYGYDGADVIKGGDGDDWLEGGAGRDRFYGGAGADRFVFRDGDFSGVTSATCDRIHDFDDSADVISLSLVDANVTVAGDQDFAFVGTGAFTHTAGELRYQQISGNTYIQGDTDGDGVADFWLRLDGLHTLDGGNILS